MPKFILALGEQQLVYAGRSFLSSVEEAYLLDLLLNLQDFGFVLPQILFEALLFKIGGRE